MATTSDPKTEKALPIAERITLMEEAMHHLAAVVKDNRGTKRACGLAELYGTVRHACEDIARANKRMKEALAKDRVDDLSHIRCITSLTSAQSRRDLARAPSRLRVRRTRAYPSPARC